MAKIKKKVCIKCKATESPRWTNAENLGAVCLDCVNETKDSMRSYEVREKKEVTIELSKSSKHENKIRKKKLKIHRPTRNNPFGLSRAAMLRSKHSKSRRNLAFKNKKPVKSSSVVATTRTTEATWYHGQYFQIGDLVSLQKSSSEIYYGQIRGLVVDKFMQKSAALTWLIPTKESPPPQVGFDPRTYHAGPEEDILRKLSYLKFIMHFDYTYFKNKTSPYPRIDAMAEPGYIWTILYPMYYHSNVSPHVKKTEKPVEPAIMGTNQKLLSEKKPGNMTALELLEYFTNAVHEQAAEEVEEVEISENNVEVIDLCSDVPLDLSSQGTEGPKDYTYAALQEFELEPDQEEEESEKYGFSTSILPGPDEPIAHCSKTDQPYYDPEKNTMIAKPYLGEKRIEDDSDSD